MLVDSAKIISIKTIILEGKYSSLSLSLFLHGSNRSQESSNQDLYMDIIEKNDTSLPSQCPHSPQGRATSERGECGETECL